MTPMQQYIKGIMVANRCKNGRLAEGICAVVVGRFAPFKTAIFCTENRTLQKFSRALQEQREAIDPNSFMYLDIIEEESASSGVKVFIVEHIFFCG